LLPLGQNALTAYSLHVLLVPLVAFGTAGLWSTGQALETAENSAIQAAGVLLIWAMVVRWRRLIGGAMHVPATLTPMSPGLLRLCRPYGGYIGALAVASVVVSAFGAPRAAPDVREGGIGSTRARASITSLEPGEAYVEVPAATHMARAVSPSRVERGFLHSVGLEREMPYTIYLPRAYDAPVSRHYPALNMLHGMGGHKLALTYRGVFAEFAAHSPKLRSFDDRLARTVESGSLPRTRSSAPLARAARGGSSADPVA
jgi:hypothetical protein